MRCRDPFHTGRGRLFHPFSVDLKLVQYIGASCAELLFIALPEPREGITFGCFAHL